MPIVSNRSANSEPAAMALTHSRLRSFAANQLKLDASVVAIGAFDGVHRGHQKLIGSAVASARQKSCPSVVYTFDTPPKAFFAGVRVLTSAEEKLRKIELLGVSRAVVAKFDHKFASRSAEEFMEELARLNPCEIWVGADFRFGFQSIGDVALLSTRFNVQILDAVCCERGEVISSTRIRQLLGRDPWAASRLMA
ncbi:MAG: FAD synthetase family protein [Parasphingorhabdus sp.]|uniref:FAD synthetase family protein n=1 Tax=Parasphingorhabdus sp. TaxID=2709688 RepID=UPI0030029E1A